MNNNNSEKNEHNQHFLWINNCNRRCYFLIPSNHKFLQGDFKIHNLQGEIQEVDISDITQFEITSKQAQPYLEEKLNQSWQQAKEAVNIFSNFAAVTQGKQPSENSTKTTTNPFASLFTKIQQKTCSIVVVIIII